MADISNRKKSVSAEYFGGCAHTYLLKTLSAMSSHCNFRVPKKANTSRWCLWISIRHYPGRILFHTSKWNTDVTLILIIGRRSHQSCKSSLRCLIFVRTQGLDLAQIAHKTCTQIPSSKVVADIKFPWISLDIRDSNLVQPPDVSYFARTWHVKSWTSPKTSLSTDYMKPIFGPSTHLSG